MPAQTPQAVHNPASQRYNGLQLLRITAAVMVLVMHCRFFVLERLDPTMSGWTNGMFGVDLFFVISGFVMVSSSAKLATRSDGWRQFLTNRILRIVPLYWLITTLKVASYFLTAGVILHSRFDPLHVLASYLFIPWRTSGGEIAPVVGVGWTLNFEMMFYVLFAVALASRKNLLLMVGPPLAVLAALEAVVQPGWPAVSFYFSSRTLEFFFGMVIATLFRKGVRMPAWLAAPLALVSMASLLAPLPIPSLPMAVFPGLPAAVLVYAMASLEPFMGRMPGWILFLADASYVIYLVHPITAPLAAVVMARLHLQLPLVAILLGILIGILSGAALHLWVEKPVTARLNLRFKKA